MSTAALAPLNQGLLPQQPGGFGRGALLALLVHLALVAALTLSVDWRVRNPETFSAELWSAVPQVAAPKAVEPEPAPPPPPAPPPRRAETPPAPEAQIAIEKAEREKAKQEAEAREKAARDKAARDKAEQDRLQREREAKARAERELQAERKREQDAQREREAQEKRLAEQREQQLKRMMGQIGATGGPSSTGTAAQDAAPSAGYAGRLVARIKPNIVLTDPVPTHLAAEVEVRAAPNGTILGRRVVKSSGHKEWDEAVLRAIDRTGTLPRDVDGRIPSTLLILFRPD